MAKTLKDCLLEGGIKGKTFPDQTLEKNRYTVEDIHFVPFVDRTQLYVKSDSNISTKNGAHPGHDYLNLRDHWQDQLIEENQIPSTP